MLKIFRQRLQNSLAAVLVGCALSISLPASAEPLADLIQRAREALQAHGEQSRPDRAPPAAAGRSDQEDTAETAGGIGIRPGVGPSVSAPTVVVGSNGFTAVACVTFLSGSTPVTGLLTRDGTLITTTSSFFATTLNAACVVRGSVAINVTSVSGSSFTYNAVAF